MNGKILICVVVVLALQVIGISGGDGGGGNEQCKTFIGSGNSYSCYGGGTVGVMPYSMVCKNPDSNRRMCFRGNKPTCPDGFPEFDEDMSCFQCCCLCSDTTITDYVECCDQAQ